MSNTKKQAKPTETQPIDLKTQLINNYLQLRSYAGFLLFIYLFNFAFSLIPSPDAIKAALIIVIILLLFLFVPVIRILIGTMRHRKTYQNTEYEHYRQLQLRYCIYLLISPILAMFTIDLLMLYAPTSILAMPMAMLSLLSIAIFPLPLIDSFFNDGPVSTISSLITNAFEASFMLYFLVPYLLIYRWRLRKNMKQLEEIDSVVES